MATTAEQTFRDLIANDRKFIEALFVVENKALKRVPFRYNPIQSDVDKTETGMDIWVKPSQCGFSTERIAKRLKQTLTNPGTNTVLVAYDDFITERLLSKVSFFYNHLQSLNIPGLPEIFHNSTYEKTFRFIVDGRVETTSSIYIASARSYVAGRAETIHHLLLDEMAFYPPGTMTSIISPALDRVPPGGTVDAFSTPNGQENDFYGMYSMAKEGKSTFTAHFYPWFMHPEYAIEIGDGRMRFLPECNKEEFSLTADEEKLAINHGLTYSQIRWRRWKIFEKESLRRQGELVKLFQQEFPEDDVSCFLGTGDAFYDIMYVDKLAKSCYDAPQHMDGLHVWYPPEHGLKYVVCIDPGQAKITQSAIGVICFKKDSFDNPAPVWCARDAGLYTPEVTIRKAIAISNYYNRALIAWEANAHGLAITLGLKNRKPIYMRKNIVSGQPSLEPGWLTTAKTKPYMLQAVQASLSNLLCHDIELVRQLRNFRQTGDAVEIVGADDVHDSLAIGLVCLSPKQPKRGYTGRSGWRKW